MARAKIRVLVYSGPGIESWTEFSDPGNANPTDVFVRVEITTIC